MAIAVDACEAGFDRQIRRVLTVRRKAVPFGAKTMIPRCQENPLRRTKGTVPQTDTGSRGEYPQALE